MKNPGKRMPMREGTGERPTSRKPIPTDVWRPPLTPMNIGEWPVTPKPSLPLPQPHGGKPKGQTGGG